MSVYTQIRINQNPNIHGSEDLHTKEINDSIIITIDGNDITSSVDITASSIAEMRRFARTILEICDDTEKHRRVSSQEFCMFSDEGNKAVSDEIKSYDLSMFSDSEKFASLVENISLTVYKKGFPEVYDTAVRERIWDVLEAKIADS